MLQKPTDGFSTKGAGSWEKSSLNNSSTEQDLKNRSGSRPASAARMAALSLNRPMARDRLSLWALSTIQARAFSEFVYTRSPASIRRTASSDDTRFRARPSAIERAKALSSTGCWDSSSQAIRGSDT